MNFEVNKAKKLIMQSSLNSSIYIGSDSSKVRLNKKSNKWEVRYVTAFILHLDSCKGGKVLYNSHRESYRRKISMKARLLTEVQYSVEMALSIIDCIGSRNFEVHLDINDDPNAGSSVAVKEAVGWIVGMGFNYQIKPNSFVASFVADKLVRTS